MAPLPIVFVPYKPKINVNETSHVYKVPTTRKQCKHEISKKTLPVYLSKYSKPSSELTKEYKQVMPVLQMCQANSVHPTQSQTKSSKPFERNLPLFRHRGPERWTYVSAKYSQLLHAHCPDFNLYADLFTYDYSLFSDKLKVIVRKTPVYTHYIPIAHYPYFLGYVRTSEFTSSPLFASQVIGDDSIAHYLSTHAGRRRFIRQHTYYHIHQEIFEILYPSYCYHDPAPRAAPQCGYRCFEFYQNCNWHKNMEYDARLRCNRELLYKILCHFKLNDSLDFWLSLGLNFNDQSIFISEPDEEENTQRIISYRLRPKSVPPHLPYVFFFMTADDDPNSIRLANPKICEPEEICGELLPDKYLYLMYPALRRHPDAIRFSKTQIAQAKLEPTFRLRYEPVPTSPTTFTHWNCGRVFTEFREYAQHVRDNQCTGIDMGSQDQSADAPLMFTRHYVTDKLTSLLHLARDAKDALPRWIHAHSRFIINLVCNCVSLTCSKSWMACLASLSALTNEILSEFPQLLRDRVDALVNCLKQVLSRFFPVAQAQPTFQHDHQVANESFITSLFSILSSLIPGVSVDAQLLKARVQRIQLMSQCLNSAKHIGEWFCMIFDKIWIWVQIYWFGATSEDLARVRSLLASPEIQTWINDVTALEKGKSDEQGKCTPPLIVNILKDPELQARVIELRTTGENIMATLATSDKLHTSRLMTLVQTHMKKLDRWYKMFEDVLGSSASKHEPFIIYLYGEPGVGKSYCVDYICQALAKVVGREYDPNRDKFGKPRDSQYHDGYNNQFCYYLDDFLQVPNEQANASEISFLIDAGSRTPYHMSMAALEKKATSYFTSPLVIVTSNKQLCAESFEQMIESFPALARRIDVSVEVRRDPSIRVSRTENFDPRGLYFELSRFRLEKSHINGGVFEPLGRPCEWGMFLSALSVLFVKKMRHQEKLDTMATMPKQLEDTIVQYANRYSTIPADDHEIIDMLFERHSMQLENANWNVSPNYIGHDRQEEIAGIDRFVSPVASHISSHTTLNIDSLYQMEPQEKLEEPLRLIERVQSAPDLVEEHIRQRQVTQAGELEPGDYYCPVTNCTHVFPRDIQQRLVFRHFLVHAQERTVSGDRHDICARDMEDFLNNFVIIDEVPLNQQEEELYASAQQLFVDYKPYGSPWSISELLIKERYGFIREVLEIYQQRESTSLLTRIYNWPMHMMRSGAAHLRRCMSNTLRHLIDMAKSSYTDMLNEARQTAEKLAERLGGLVIGGIVCTVLASVFAFCLMRWWKSPDPKPLEEAFVSGDLRTSAKKKKIRRVEAEEYEPEAFVSGDLRTAAKKKRKQRVECRYAANYRVNYELLNSVTMTRVDVTEDPDLTVMWSEGKLSILWRDGEQEDHDIGASTVRRDIEFAKIIAKHFNDMDATYTEAKTDRMELVKEQIGKYPRAEASRDAATTDLCQILSHNLARVINLHNGLVLNGVFLENSILMFPRHLLGAEDPNGKTIKVVVHEGQSLTLTLGDTYPFVEREDKDTIFVDLRKTHIPARPSIVNKFMKESDEIRRTAGYLLSPVISKDGLRLDFLQAKQLLDLEPIERAEYQNMARNMTYTTVGCIAYKGDSVSGDCGSLILRMDTREPRKLLGFHVAGSTGDGTGVVWTQEQLKHEIARFQVMQAAFDLEFVPLDLDEFYDCIEPEEYEDCVGIPLTYIEPIAMIDRALAPGCPLTTSLRPSPIYEQIIPSSSGPSTLRPFVDSSGQRKEPLKIALSKLEAPLINFEPELLDKCALRMRIEYKKTGRLQWYGSSHHGKLTLRENIQGVEDDEWIKPINMKTSPGYPYVLAGNKGKYINSETAEISSILENAIRQREEMCRNGEEMPALMIDVLKDERLSNDKREKGKVRIFNVCPLDFNMLVRKYFTRFMAQMMNDHVRGEVSVGLNPHADDWKAFHMCLHKSGDHWIAGDYSAWDKRMPYQVAMALLPLVEEFYQQFSDYEPQDAMVREVLLRQAFQSVRLAQTQTKGLIYRVHQSMPSGIAVTAVYNSLINALLFRVIYAELAIKNGLSHAKAVNEYSQHVKFAAYGDDHIARVDNFAFPFFNMLTISSQMAEHNITYTAATKEDVTGPEVQDEDLTYLKRRFVNRAGRMDAPMDLTAILDILNWVNASNPYDVNEACEAAIKSVLIELSHHSRKDFNIWYEKILKIATRAGLDVPVVSYDEVVNIRRNEDFDYYENFLT
uniref:Non-structural polyprotein n=1 Tax=Arivirus 1 TaxID=1552986 RepID=A0A097BW38_9VIRU|nr:non-structural polyprotein [Arivirus 1]